MASPHGPLGSGHPNLVPYQAYQAQDAYFVIAVGNDAMWQKLCSAIDRPDLGADAELITNNGRLANRERLNLELEKSLKARTVAAWCELFAAQGVPASPIRSLDEVYAHPHTAALDMVQIADHPVIGDLKQVAFPVNFRGQRPQVRTAPPMLGADNDTVLPAYSPQPTA